MIGMWQPGEHRGGVVGGDGRALPLRALHPRLRHGPSQFYKDVFGWEPDTAGDEPDFRYTVLPVADGEQAGIMDASDWLPEGVPAHWSVYFAVDDVDATLAKVEGARRRRPSSPARTPPTAAWPPPPTAPAPSSSSAADLT